MSFIIHPLSSKHFAHLYGKSDAELKAQGIIAYIAQAKGFPCRVTLRDAEPGERILLTHFEHQTADTPYRSSHAIFVIDGATAVTPFKDEIPESLATRLLSVRAFDARGMMVGADVIEGNQAAPLFETFLAMPEVSYLHVHNARYGCYMAKVVLEDK